MIYTKGVGWEANMLCRIWKFSNICKAKNKLLLLAVVIKISTWISLWLAKDLIKLQSMQVTWVKSYQSTCFSKVFWEPFSCCGSFIKCRATPLPHRDIVNHMWGLIQMNLQYIHPRSPHHYRKGKLQQKHTSYLHLSNKFKYMHNKVLGNLLYTPQSTSSQMPSRRFFFMCINNIPFFNINMPTWLLGSCAPSMTGFEISQPHENYETWRRICD